MTMSKELVDDTLKIIDKMFYMGEKINFYTVKEKADVSRTFLYKHPEIVNKINYYKKLNSMPIIKRVEYFKKENKTLMQRVDAYEELIIKAISSK